MSTNIGVGASKAGYSASAEFQGLPKVSASIDVNISKVDVFFTAEMCTNDSCSLHLKTFEIKEIGKIDVDIDGLGPIDWVLEQLKVFMEDDIRKFIADVLEEHVKGLLQDILNDNSPNLEELKDELPNMLH